MSDTRTIHAIGCYWSNPDQERVGSFETGSEAKLAAKAWMAARPDAKEVFIFNGITPMFSVYAAGWLYDKHEHS